MTEEDKIIIDYIGVVFKDLKKDSIKQIYLAVKDILEDKGVSPDLSIDSSLCTLSMLRVLENLANKREEETIMGDDHSTYGI